MRYIENYELREWVKENLKKSIFQKAHALALQTGCEILVKLEDGNDIATDTPRTQYYATKKMQRAYRRGCVVCRMRPGETSISGETGLPATVTVDTAVQSCDNSPMEPRGLDRLSGFVASTSLINVGALNQNASISTCAIPLALSTSSHNSKPESVVINPKNLDGMRAGNTSKHLKNDSNTGMCDASTEQTWEESSDTLTTGAPSCASVKSEPQDTFETSGEAVVNDEIDYSADSLEESVAMETLPTGSEDLYDIDDYYGSGVVDDDDEDGGNEMDPQQSVDNAMTSGIHHNSHVGGDGTAADMNNGIPNINIANQIISPSITSHPSNPTSEFDRPAPMSTWVRARPSLPSSRPFHKAPSRHTPSVNRKRKPMHLERHAPPHNYKYEHALITPDAVGVHLSYPTTLPSFSRHVQIALENGTVQKGKMWHTFCKEVCQFYLPLLDVCDLSNAYQNIGRTMYERFPCIGMAGGVKPWTSFNKYLSNKIRQARFQAKKKEQEQEQESQEHGLSYQP